MTTLGKYLAGGLSFGAFGGRADLMAAFDPARGGGLTHGGTFNNNAFTMAVGAAAADAIVDATALAAVNERGDRLRAGLDARFAASPLDFCVTGWGSMINVHPVAGPVHSPGDLAAADRRWRELFFHDLLAAGFYLAPRGYLALTMDVTDDDGTLPRGRRAVLRAAARPPLIAVSAPPIELSIAQARRMALAAQGC